VEVMSSIPDIRTVVVPPAPIAAFSYRLAGYPPDVLALTQSV